MDQETLNLAQLLVEKLQNTPSSSRLLVGIAGIPASGKSTFAVLLTKYTNNILASTGRPGSSALLIGLDGWHLSRSQLDQFPNPKLAHDRRGSHWTFDGPGYVAFDPTYDDVAVHPHHRIVIIEGLYTLLSIAPWSEAGLLLDERWLIQVEIDKAQQRLVKRHVVTGVAKDMEEAIWRAEENDKPNGQLIIANMLEPTRIIQSIDDESIALS
ncbi:hypothetical protein H0H92_008076 [Tricholoma furcatifolium]|nr:hypothetical protein H0H92_008076 [Tricholoma furcatifolium]